MKKVLSLVCLLAIVASCLFVFASCGGATPNSDIAKAEEALKAAGYTVNKVGTSKLMANKGQDSVIIDYCDTEAAAQAIYDSYVAADEAQKELADAMGVDYESGAYGISGTMVWAGTDAAVKAAQ